MPHLRNRHVITRLKKQATLWPVIALVGPRQVGKTTCLEQLFSFQDRVSLDDDGILADAKNSATSFIARQKTPVLLDEVQKAPLLLDAIKLAVHRQKKPGQFFLTGSTSFSEGSGIRESLTGRIGSSQLLPLTIAEANEVQLQAVPQYQFKEGHKPRFDVMTFSKSMETGGMPVPMFLRDQSQVHLYWDGWLATTILRDLARLIGRGFEPDFAYEILNTIAKILAEGEYPTSIHFNVKSTRKLNRYLYAMELLFVLKRIRCHEAGQGKDIWIFFDSGLASYLMRNRKGEGATLSLARLTIFNEIQAAYEYNQEMFFHRYFKSIRGSVVDLILHDIPIRIVPLSDLSKGPWGWYTKALAGAMNKLGASKGILLAPVTSVHKLEKNIWVYPWSIWS